jgi:hypothetical protein
MILMYRDLEGKEHEFYNGLSVEEVVDVVSEKVIGYKIRGPYVDDNISKETYEAIKKQII